MRMKALFITHQSLLNPILHSQGLPHIRELVKRGVNFTILSFEKRRWNEEEKIRIYKVGTMLKDQGIDWRILRYTKIPFLPTGAIDILTGFLYSSLLVLVKRIRIVHTRSYVPAAVGLLLKKLIGIKFIFDLRGLFADEYAAVGNWSPKGIFYRLTKIMERWCILSADVNVVVSEPFKDYIKGLSYVKNARGVPVEMIPNCVDLDRFVLSPSERDRKRREHGLSDRLLLIYTGSLLKWQLPEEMVDFFCLLKRRSEDACFWIITYDDPSTIRSYLKMKGLGVQDYSLFSSSPEEVSSYVMMGDVGISFGQQTFTRQVATFPTKFAEYLASGLPVVINSGIGGTDKIVKDYNLGVVIDRFDSDSYVNAADRLLALLGEGEPLKKRCRQVAEEFLSLNSAVNKYHSLYQRLCGRSGGEV
jgi:glycosyltransferase involved in cell wall biosynthesis